jgi:maleate isomerase
MTDVYGYRLKLGVITPSVNTTVQPEYDAMRPAGVTNHLARIFVPDIATGAEGTLEESVNAIDKGVDDAVERVLTCDPAALVMGVSLEAIYGDPHAGQAIEDRLRRKFDRPDLRVIHAGTAIPAALRALGIDGGAIALLTPYGPGAEPHLESFMKGCGYELGQVEHLVSASLVQIAHNEPEVVRAKFRSLLESRPAAVLQFGANLPAAYVAAEVEARHDIPVLAINTVTYWHALRENGIQDRVTGFGRLLSEH